MNASRRAFFRAASGLAAAGLGAQSLPLALNLAGLGALAASQAHAANTADGYKALVCLFLQGGNDSHNWVVPTDSANYKTYATARGDLALPLASLLPLSTPGQDVGRSFGMPPELAPLRQRYESGHCAVLANVGTLLRPTTKADFQAGVGLPAKLFSHNDQLSMWQSMSPEGAAYGWGGRMADILMSANRQPVFTAVTASGNAVFLSGTSTTPFAVGANGPTLINPAQTGWHAGSALVPGLLRSQIANGAPSNEFEAEYLRTVQRSLAAGSTLQSAIGATSVPALPTGTITLNNGATFSLSTDTLARQLRVVAQLIAAGPGLGMKRQVFFVSLNGFDAHAAQMRQQPLQMARVAHAAGWFLDALQSLNLLNNTTLFTASEFGRTLVSNGDGSDHGWGSHHLVMGGGVRGKRIVGNFPITALGTSTDTGSGRLLPTTSVTQLAASLGGWMGLTTAEQSSVLSNLASFGASPPLFA
ncbi:DUF1501 domain-containing protein [Roseateles sp. BYS87W]|uniref:DUF1501 domain-containing protein n=1 Tax=Pelomonas baiyunensis TaxID=3299026 RepID=A0ABW7H3I4_9BURK